MAGFNLIIRDSYFTILVDILTNHILVEYHISYFMNQQSEHITRFWSLNLQRSTKLFRNAVIWKHSYWWFPTDQFIYRKFCQHYFFTVPGITNCKDDTINHSNSYCLIYSGARRAFCKIMHLKKMWFFCNIQMHHFKELSWCVKQNINK